MYWHRCVAMCRGCIGPSALTTKKHCRRSRRSYQHYALGTSAGVRGHGAAGRAGGAAPAARSQTPPFYTRMGKTAEIASHGGAVTRDGGARDACEVGRRGRAPRSAAQHTAARRRVRARCASTAPSRLSASRADEEQLPASAEQVRERRPGVGGRGGGGRAASRRQEGRAAAEGDALVGAHGRARVPAALAAALPARRDGAAPHAARAHRAAGRVTSPLHAYIPLPGHSRSLIDLIFIYSGAGRPPRLRLPRAVFEFREN